MTHRRYYDDAYTTAFDATIIETTTHDGKPALILDQTCFYPTGGGQPHDTGTIGGVRVIDVITRADDKAVLHMLAGAPPSGNVRCELDWARRFDHMQQHSGQHILTQAFVQTCGANTIGFHLGDSVTIDVDVAALTPAQIETAEALANRILHENRLVTTRLIDPDSADGVRMRRVPEALATAGLRVVEVTDFDVTACGGTHVRATGEIGMIKVLRTEKYKGGTRIEFACGGRALAAFRLRNDLANRLTAELSCALDDVPELIGKLRDSVTAQEKALKMLRERLIEYEAQELIASAVPLSDGVRCVVAVFEGRDAAELRLLAARITREVGMIALLGLAGEKAHVVCARSTDGAADMNGLLQAVLAPLGGRGGGQPALAQGGAGAVTAEALRAALAEATR
jgi:alanyl-tRNA synthetase